MPTDI